MSRKKTKNTTTNTRKDDKKVSPVAVWFTDGNEIACKGYTNLSDNPEIMTACHKIAELIGSLTIYLMANTERGDQRIINELSRKIDIEPEMHMTRSTWVQGIVMNLLLYGKGNAIVVPHTYKGNIVNLEPIGANRVSFLPIGYRDYKVLIDGKAKDPESVCHFVYNPDKNYLWKGKGLTVFIKDIVNNLAQATQTETAFMSSKWKPSIIVKVDALTDEFSNPTGRQKLLDSYVKSADVGEPWLIPAQQFDVEQVKPLSLADLAISDTVKLNKQTVAAILGVPPFLLGVGEYNTDAWNNFVNNTVKPICLSIQQELTKKLIISERMYLKFNILSLLDWDIETIYRVFGGLADKGIVTPNEVRDRIGLNQLDGLDQLRILENYVPVDRIGDQKKLIQKGDGENE